MVPPRSGKKFVKHRMTQNADMRRESGTCNVCSAPCSSCMHLNRALMGSKADEFSDESCRLGEANQYSVDEGGLSSLSSRGESLQYAISETSNMLSVNSSHDSLSENADSRRTLSHKYRDSKCLEGLDDNSSCISRTSDANLINGSDHRNADSIIVSCSSASVSLLGAECSGSAPSIDMSGIPTSKTADIRHCSLEAQGPYTQSGSGKSRSSSPSILDLERVSCSHIPEKLSECSVENTESSLTKETAPTVVSADKPFANKDSLVDVTAKVSLRVFPKLDDTDNGVGDATDEAHKFSVQYGLDEKAKEQVESLGMKVPLSVDESDESDVVEHDVKVCDICGDAGREDLLAICGRCSDGAEHTYCMREMLQKVPEGEWLCEECKCAEETENQRLDVEERQILKTSSTSQVSGKRHSENMEVAQVLKRQAIESITGSPKPSSPKITVPLSLESSFKSLDKGKLKPSLQMPICHNSGGDESETARSPSNGLQGSMPKGTLLKSNSFNTVNSKLKVKLADEVVLQKQKGTGEHSTKNVETPARMISKSMSFKSTNLGRSSATESKVKMLPRSTSGQDFKGSRHTKESGAFDRKILPRIDRPAVTLSMGSSVVSTPKGDQKLTPRSETSKHVSVSNNRELKVNQDGKPCTLSKSKSNVGHKSVESPVCSERASSGVDETPEDMLPRSREMTDQIEKTRDSSSDCIRPGSPTALKSPFYQKCKEVGHPTECCTVSSTPESCTEVSPPITSSSREEVHKDNRLKAAIHAALLRRPEIYKKKELLNQNDEFSALSADVICEATSQDQLLCSNTPKNCMSADETSEGKETFENFTNETSKCLSINYSMQSILCPTDSGSQPRNSDSCGPSAVKPAVRDLPNQALAISRIFVKSSAIPEYEYAWQGDFEVHKGGKAPDLCAGIQAHLSTCASPKVLEVVNKFQLKVPLNEVPRLSTWPSHFHQDGAKEDNIALYFFAKDIESYERHYKGLLDHMIRNDLALTGVFDGIELLIFSSNQLPEKSQRWNMLFFLWGVFRGRRTSYSYSEKKISIPSLNVISVERDLPTAVMTLSETCCLPKPMDGESVACDRRCSMVPPSTSPDQNFVSLSRNSDIIEPYVDQKILESQVKLEKQVGISDTKSTSRTKRNGTQMCQEMKSTGLSPEVSLVEHVQGGESKPCPEAIGTSVTSQIVETEIDSEISIKKENSLTSGIPSLGKQEIDAASNVSEDKILEKTYSDRDQLRPKRKQKEDDQHIDIKAVYQGDLTAQRVNCQQPNDNKLQHIDLSDAIMQASAFTCQGMPWNEVNGNLEDGESSSKKLTVQGVNCPQPNANKLQHIDLSDTVMKVSADTCQRMPWNEVNGNMEDGESSSKKLTAQGVSCQQPNDNKLQHIVLSDTVMQVSAATCQGMPWNEVNGNLEDGESSSKKLKSGISGIYGCISSGGRDSFNDRLASLANDLGSCSSVDDRGCEEACDEKIICEDLGTRERTFFPLDTLSKTDSQLGLNSLSLQGPHEYEIPNLELALGGETKQQHKGMLPFFVGAVDKKISQEKPLDCLADEQEDDSVAASLSLSLSFPSSNKEWVKPGSKAEQLLPDGHRVNTSLFLFGRFTDK